MLKIQKIIHQTWKTKDVPYDIYRKDWVDSWKKLHPGWEYVLWTDEDNSKFIKKYYSWFFETYDSYPEGIYRADAIRYFLLYHYGGLYVDLDYQCLKNFEPLLANYDVVLSYMGKDKEFSESISNAIMASSKGASLWPMVFKELRASVKNADYVENVTGPCVLRRAVLRYLKMQGIPLFGKMFLSQWVHIYASKYLCPIDWHDMTVGLDEGAHVPEELMRRPAHFFPNAYAVTYWTHNW